VTLLLLDEGPLSLVTNPRESEPAKQCTEWLTAVLARGVRVMVPATADYELRRELLRANRLKGLGRLDALIEHLGYVEIDRDVLEYAATLWAWARNEGIPTADDKALDCDVILAAQALIAAPDSEDEVIVVTTNVAHLERFVTAQTWENVAHE